MLDWCIKKIQEVILNLSEMADGSSPEHQAKKLERVAKELIAMRELLTDRPKGSDEPDASTQTHGSGTGGHD